MKKIFSSLMIIFLSFYAFSASLQEKGEFKKDVVLVGNFDVNNSFWLGDAKTGSDIEYTIKNQMAKDIFIWDDKSHEKNYSETQKDIETAAVDKARAETKEDESKFKKREQEAKKARQKNVIEFIDNHPDGSLKPAYDNLKKKALSQNYSEKNNTKKEIIESREAPNILFDSFLNMIDFCYKNGIDLHIVLRSFGSDLDRAINIIETEIIFRHMMMATFTRGKFVGETLYIFNQEEVKYKDEISGVDINSSKDVLFNDEDIKMLDNVALREEAIANLKRRKLIAQVIDNPCEIKEVLTEMPFLAIQDNHAPWKKSKENWAYGKLFPILLKKDRFNRDVWSFFTDDNIEIENNTQGIVRPVILDETELKWKNIPPYRLLNTRLFQVKPLSAMADPDYYINFAKTTLQAYCHENNLIIPKFLYPVMEKSLESKDGVTGGQS